MRLVGVLAVVGVLLSSSFYHAEASYSVALDESSNFVVSWTQTETRISFELVVKTTGWVGFGWSGSGGMTNADMAVIEVVDGSPRITDRHTGDSKTEPTIDNEQDWTLQAHTMAAGVTTIIMDRPIKLCRENKQDISITSDTMRVIYAYGSSEQIAYHGFSRGTKSLYLLLAEVNSARPDNALDHDLLMGNVIIPAQDTTYWCTLIKLPIMTEKNHIISFEPIIQPGNELYVHHMLVYACFHEVDGDAHISNNMHSNECYGPNMPDDAKNCRSTMVGWAVGGGRVTLPEEAGYALGASDSPTFVVIEMHYDNPSSKSGIVDNSGMRFTYTPTLRPNDVGTIQVGATKGIIVPPGSVTDVAFQCSKDCLNPLLPETGVTMFSSLLHSHLLGRKISLRHNRSNGTSYILSYDHSYDFNFQETRVYHERVKLEKGDSLQITCTMDGTNREDVTVGGLRTADEMCLAFISYYPRMNMEYCGSFPAAVAISPYQLADSRLVNGLLGLTPTASPVADADIRAVNWNLEKTEVLQDSYYQYDHAAYCTDRSRNVAQGSVQVIASETIKKGDNTIEECQIMEDVTTRPTTTTPMITKVTTTASTTTTAVPPTRTSGDQNDDPTTEFDDGVGSASDVAVSRVLMVFLSVGVIVFHSVYV